MTPALRSLVSVLVAIAALSGAACKKKEPPPTAEPARPSDIILVTLDTTRRDHIGAYGYERPVSPNLDGFAKGADLYTKAYASSSWTVPTHASILTGLHASDHGAHSSPAGGIIQLRPDVTTLAERLHAQGYATAAIVGAHTLNERFGLARGFDLYDAPAGETLLASRRADAITSRALSWLDANDARPVFLFVNYFDPHIPYRASGACQERFAKGISPHLGSSSQWLKRPVSENLQLYDAEICFMDEQFGVLIEGLKKRGRFENAMIVVAADHGENFDAEKGIHHGDSLDEALIRVPLFVKRPQQQSGTRVDEVFETRSLFYTMLGATKDAEKDPPPTDDVAEDFAVSELWAGKAEDANPVLRALVRWPLKLLAPPGDGSDASKLYDLSTPEAESTDLAEKKSDDKKTLEALLQTWVAERDGVSGAPVELDPEMVEKLRALGYLE